MTDDLRDQSRRFAALPQPLSRRSLIPRTIVFASLGDGERAAESWLAEADDASRDYSVAIVYCGSNPESPWACYRRRRADHFDVHAGEWFANLLWWAERNSETVHRFDYWFLPDETVRASPDDVGRMARTTRDFGLAVCSPGLEGTAERAWAHRPRIEFRPAS